MIGAGGFMVEAFAAIEFRSVPETSQPLAEAPFGSARP